MRRKFLLASFTAAAFGLAACGPYQLNENERTVAELGARDHADRSGSKFIACSGQDSDGDDYVTCTITADANVGGPERELLCSYKSRGCKNKA